MSLTSGIVMAPRECTIECSGFLTVARLGAGGENTDSADLSMAKRPTTLDCTAFPVPVPVGRNAGARRTETTKQISRTWSLPAVPCRRRRRRCSSGRRLPARARSTCAGLRDRELRAGNRKPEVEFSPEVGRSRSASDVVELSSSEKSSRSVCCSGDVTATTSFQTCFDEDDEGPALTTSSADTDQPITVLEEPSPRCRGGGLASVTSVVNAAVGLRPPRHDGHRLCPPASASRDRRSASVGTVRPSTIARSRFNNVGADFGETDVPVDQSIVVPIGVGDGVGTGGTPVPPNSGKKTFSGNCHVTSSIFRANIIKIGSF